MSSVSEPDVIFLGICDRANYDANVGKWNILGLGHIVFTYVFPLKLTSSFLGINATEDFIKKKNNIQIINNSGEEIATLTLNGEEITVPDAENIFVKKRGQAVMLSDADRATIFISLHNLDIVFLEPGLYHLSLLTEAGVKKLGSFQIALVDPLPLTTERKSAIKSDPAASKAIQIELGCKFCPTKYRVYSALEKTDYPGCEWYEDVPDKFICECGKTTISLQYIRRNLHAFLGQKTQSSNIFDFVPLYETSALRTTRSNFAELLEESPKEESLQIFIKENPILLHQFPAEMIISKPPIFSKYVADFAILTAQRELILVEIEKTTTRLMKKDGHLAAELVHAFEQVRDWLHVIDDHRDAVLDDLNIDRQDVNKIRGVVIAGREKNYDAHKLRRLKMSSHDRLSFLTFDDLLFAMDALINKFDAL